MTPFISVNDFKYIKLNTFNHLWRGTKPKNNTLLTHFLINLKVVIAVDQHMCSKISICTIWQAEAGTNIPCADSTKFANITWDTDRLVGQTGVLDLEYVTNHGK